jgi:hypothetical protein
MDKIIATDFWVENNEKLLEKINSDDVNNFLRWDFIIQTMFAHPPKQELEYLKSHGFYRKWRRVLKEDPFGNPVLHDQYEGSSGNLIHHAYSLSQLYKYCDFDILNCKSIFEFGGGYGSFYRLVRKIGFTGKYSIYDLPAFLALQNKFISSVFGNCDNVFFLNDIKEKEHVDLFISLWAISECPLTLRESVLNNIDSDIYLIAYQSEFDGIDNINYFNAMKDKLKNTHSVDIVAIKHYPGNFYFLARKNNK